MTKYDLPCRIHDGYMTPDEDADYLTPEQELELKKLELEKEVALAREDMREADRLNDLIKDIFAPKKDEWGFWV